MKEKFALIGNVSYGNRGSEAIIRGTISALETVFDDCDFVNAYFPDINPDQKSGGWDKKVKYIPLDRNNPKRNTTSFKWWNYKLLSILDPERAKLYRFRIMRTVVKKSSAVLMVGGDNYSLDYGYPNTFFNLNEFVLKLDKPLILWGASVGPFSKDPKFEKWAAMQLKKINRIYARESVTVSYLQSIGVSENVIRVADPAFLMEPEEADFSNEILSFCEQGSIGLNLISLIGRYIPGVSPTDWIQRSRDIIIQILNDLTCR